MLSPPAITVLLAVHNGAAYLQSCLDSISAQTFPHFNVVVVDDASTDATASLLHAHGQRDNRFITLTNDENIGLTKSLNVGLLHAKGHYIARLDADDIMHKERLQQQYDFLEAHLDYGIVGCFAENIRADGSFMGIQKTPVTNPHIQWFCLIASPFLHPAVMLRRSILETAQLAYDESFRTTQDYALWSVLLQYTKGHNLPTPLISLRVHDGAISSTKKGAQFENHQRIAARTILEHCGIEMGGTDIAKLLQAFHQPRHVLSLGETSKAVLLYVRLYRAFARKNDTRGVRKIIVLRIVRAFLSVIRR